MLFFITVLHVVLCLLLIVIIILQPGKGSDVASAFGGGGSGTVFGPRGPTSMLSRATTVVAVLFLVTSITLALNSDRQVGSSSSIEEMIRQQEALDRQEQESSASPGAASPGAASPGAASPTGAASDAPGEEPASE